MALIARITDFIPGQPILSGEVDAELNNIDDALRGTATDKNFLFRFSDAGIPVLDLDQLSTGLIQRWKKGGVAVAALDSNGLFQAVRLQSTVASGTAPLLISSPTVCANLNADMVDGQHYTDIQNYVNGRKVWWSMNWFIPDPSTFPLNSLNLAQKVNIPEVNTFTAVRMFVIYNTGTASGQFKMTMLTHPFSNQAAQSTLGSVDVNPGSVGVGAATDIVDHTFNSNDWVYPVIETRSSPLQRDVSISLVGYQTPTS